MPLFDDFDDEAVQEDLGTWRAYGKDKVPVPDGKGGQVEKEVVVRFRIRALSFTRQQAFRARYGLDKIRTHGKAAGVIDIEKERKASRDAASWALTGSENFTIRLKDEVVAKLYGDLLGCQIKPGEIVRVDDRLQAIKDRVLDRFPSIALWVERQASELHLRGVEAEVTEEEGRKGN